MSLLPSVTVPRVAVRIANRGSSTQRLRGAIIAPIHERLLRITKLERVGDRAHSKTNIVHLRFSFNIGASLTFVRIGRGVSTTVGDLPGRIAHPGTVGTDTASVPMLCIGVALGGSNTCRRASRRRFLRLYRLTRGIIGHHVRRLPRITVTSVAKIPKELLRVIPSGSGLTVANVDIRSVRGALSTGGMRPKDVLIESNCCRCGVHVTALLHAPRSIGGVCVHGKRHVVRLGRLYGMSVISRGRVKHSMTKKGETMALTVVGRDSRGVSIVGRGLGRAASCFTSLCPSVRFDIDHGRARLLSCAVSGLRRGLSLNFLFVFVMTILFLKSIHSPLVVNVDVIASVMVAFFFFCFYRISLGIVSLSNLVLTMNVVVSDTVVMARGVSRCHRQKCSLGHSYTINAARVVAPVLDSSLAAVTMFIPLVFVDNVTKTVFVSRTFSVAIKLVVSCVANVVLLPMLCLLFCGINVHDGKFLSEHFSGLLGGR